MRLIANAQAQMPAETQIEVGVVIEGDQGRP